MQVWKSDTSSDEIDGHVLALSAVAALSPDAAEQSLARELLANLLERIVDGNLYVVDGRNTSDDPSRLMGLLVDVCVLGVSKRTQPRARRWLRRWQLTRQYGE